MNSELRAKHRMSRLRRTETWCPLCHSPWPCSTIRLLDEVEQLRAEVVRLTKWNDERIALMRHLDESAEPWATWLVRYRAALNSGTAT